LSAARLILPLVVLGIGATSLCALVGFNLARQSDNLRIENQHAAVRAGIAEFRSSYGDGNELDTRLVDMVAQLAGIKDLGSEADAALPAAEFEPVLNRQGRIAGFLTWPRETPMTAIMKRLLPLIGGIALCLIGFTGFSLRQLGRARRELAASEQHSSDLAEQDPVTGLFNHAKMMSLLDTAMAAQSEQGVVTYGLLALGRLDAVTDGAGHSAGDDIVSAVAVNLREALPAATMCGRVGKHEFAVLWSGVDDPQTIMRAAIEAATRPYWVDTVIRITAHAGFAQAPRDASSREELARRTEGALRAAGKRGPGSIVAFEPAIDSEASEQQFIRRELPRALKAQALELHYQPIVTSDGASIVGVEALLRWHHHSRGAIPPASFIPVAEQMGLIDELGTFVLHRALQDAKRWPEFYISVNLSPLQARNPDIVRVVREALRNSGIEPSRLMLEITEGVLIDDPEEMLTRIGELRALGVCIALDDFGSGYSSLGYLQRFPFDKLKVDRSFVSALGRSLNAGVILQAIVALGRALGVTVVVEGVENEEQRVLLRLAGCDEMQGFLFAKPAPAQAIDRLMLQPRREKTAAA
jgi:diguanylate cyclase (GGDEF)-like protein